MDKDLNNELLYASFNQDYKCFILGKKEGFTVYHTEPFKKGFKRGKIFKII